MSFVSKLIKILQLYKTYRNYKFLNLKKIPLASISSSQDIQLISTVDFRGGLTLEELCVIISLTKYFNIKKYLEIGSFRGRTAINVALNNPDVNIHTIDLPEDFSKDKLKYKLHQPNQLVGKIY